MKFANLSNKVRWILAVTASLIVFIAGASIASSFPNLQNGSWAFFCFIAVLLTGIVIAPLQWLRGKRFITVIAVLFILSCLIPPWLSIVNETLFGNTTHSRTPAGYAFLFNPPAGIGFQIDFGRLFLEWAALAAVTGMVWMLFVKPNWPRK
jgi:hypothetical protein